MRRLAALAALAASCWAGGAAAQPQAFPEVASPLRIEADHNGVNLATGQTTIEGPVLSVPAAPNLRFDRVQNAAPYVKGIVHGQAGQTPSGNWSVHTGGASESFACADVMDCASVTGTGSVFRPPTTTTGTRAVYRQAGTGAVWTFNLATIVAGQNRHLYASGVTYPNGEQIGYAYDAVFYAATGQTLRRPTGIGSNFGYHITLTYQGDDLAGDPGGWATVATATIYRSAAPNVPLRRLTYSGATITDSGGTIADPTDDRIFTCTGCSGTLGGRVESWSGSLRLPGDDAPSLQVTAHPTANVVGAVIRDGVQWTYTYLNLRQEQATGPWLYNSVTVTGPNDFSQTYGMMAAGPPGRRYNRMSGVTDPIGRHTAYLHDHADRPTQITYPELNRVSVLYDEAGNVTSRTRHARPNMGSPIAESATYLLPWELWTCDASCWRPLSSRDGLGRQTDYTYTGSGQLETRLDPADAGGVRRRTTIVYTDAGVRRPREMRLCGVGTTCGTDQEIVSQYEYVDDTPLVSLERRLDLATGAAIETRHSYDAAGRRTATDGPLPGPGDTGYSRYDAMGRLAGTISPDPDGAGGGNPFIAVRNSYDPAGRLIGVETGTLAALPPEAVAPAGWTGFTVARTAQTQYAQNRKVREWAREGAAGAVRTMTEYSYDGQGRLECTAVRMNPAVFAFTLDPLPDACQPNAPGGAGPDRIARNVHDAAGQRLQARVGVGYAEVEAAEATWEYNGNGQITAVIDGNGNRATLRYDGHMRQDRWTFPSADGPAGTVNPGDYEEYSYDAADNRTSLRKRDGRTIAFAYDALGRVTARTYPQGGARPVHYAWDLMGHQTRARFDNIDGEGITSTWDGFGRQLTSTSAMGGTSRTLSYRYDANGNRTRITHPDPPSNPIWFGTDYDSLGRPTLLRANGVTAMASMGYYPHGAAAGMSRANGATSEWGYDPVQRVTAVVQNAAGTSADLFLSLAYNPAGQIASRTLNNDSYAWTGHYGVTRNYLTNGLNQYARATSTTASGQSTTSFTYDLNGNLTSDGSRTYGYDIENRLISSSNGAALTYDPLGRLFQVTLGAATTRFLYDGDALVAEYDGAGTMQRRYVHWVGADVPLLSYAGATLSQPSYLHADQQGSIIMVSDQSGNPSVNRYDEYGIPQSTNTGRFQYTGQAFLTELGLYYYKARIYSPTLGRFLQTDPIGYDDQFNLYAYVGNDPVNHTDPTGEAIDVVVDVGFIVYDIYTIATEGATATNLTALGADVGSAFIPGLTGSGMAVRAARAERMAANGASRTRQAERVAVERTPSGRRVGDFTRSQRQAAQRQNAARNGGRMRCTDCPQPLQSIRNERGVPTPSNQAQVHHDPPIDRGGGRHSRRVVLCPRCHKERHRLEDSR